MIPCGLPPLILLTEQEVTGINKVSEKPCSSLTWALVYTGFAVRLLFLEDFFQQLKSIPFCFFRGLVDSLGRFLECLIGHVPRIAHIIVGHFTSAVIAHDFRPPSLDGCDQHPGPIA